MPAPAATATRMTNGQPLRSGRGRASRRGVRSNSVDLQNRVQNSPLLASPQGGVAERSINIAKHPLNARPEWFSDATKRKTTPAASISVATRHFFDDAA